MLQTLLHTSDGIGVFDGFDKKKKQIYLEIHNKLWDFFGTSWKTFHIGEKHHGISSALLQISN